MSNLILIHLAVIHHFLILRRPRSNRETRTNKFDFGYDYGLTGYEYDYGYRLLFNLKFSFLGRYAALDPYYCSVFKVEQPSYG